MLIEFSTLDFSVRPVEKTQNGAFGTVQCSSLCVCVVGKSFDRLDSLKVIFVV